MFMNSFHSNMVWGLISPCSTVLIPVWMTLTFIQGYRVMSKLEFELLWSGLCFFCTLAWRSQHCFCSWWYKKDESKDVMQAWQIWAVSSFALRALSVTMRDSREESFCVLLHPHTTDSCSVYTFYPQFGHCRSFCMFSIAILCGFSFFLLADFVYVQNGSETIRMLSTVENTENERYAICVVGRESLILSL